MASTVSGAADKRLSTLYNIMQSIEGKLGGGEGVEGIYGSITLTGMQKIYNSLRHNCGLDKSSTLVDIGAGLGRPLLHGLVEPGIKGAFGIELDQVKVSKATAFLRQALQQLAARCPAAAEPGCAGAAPQLREPEIICDSVENIRSLNPATHAYSFWEGVPHSGKEAFGRLFAASTTLKAVAVVQRCIRGEEPAGMMSDLGFGPLLLISNFPVKMSGSGRSFQAYIFSKIQPGSMAFLRSPSPLRAPAPAPLPPGVAVGATVCLEVQPVFKAQVEEAEVQPVFFEQVQEAAEVQQPGPVPRTTGIKRRRATESPTLTVDADSAAAPAAAAQQEQQQQQQPPAKRQSSILGYGRARKLAMDAYVKPAAVPGQGGKAGQQQGARAEGAPCKGVGGSACGYVSHVSGRQQAVIKAGAMSPSDLGGSVSARVSSRLAAKAVARAGL